MKAKKTQKTTKTVKAGTKQEPKKLSKWGEWIKNPQRDTIVIMDMKAVLK